jgi:hypothetical protein
VADYPVMATPAYGMYSPDADAAVHILVERIRGLPLDELAVQLAEGLDLIASMHPEVRSDALVAEVIADALRLRG